MKSAVVLDVVVVVEAVNEVPVSFDADDVNVVVTVFFSSEPLLLLMMLLRRLVAP